MSQQINLYNPLFEQRKQPFSSVPMALGLALLAVGTLMLSGYVKQRVGMLEKDVQAGGRMVEQRKARLEQVSRDFQPRQKSPELEAELAEAQAQLTSLRHIAGVLERGELGNTTGYSEYFRALARQHVDGLWLTGVLVGGVGDEISVRGRALNAALVPGYLARLKEERAMQGKTFASLQIDQPQAGPAKDGKSAAAAGSFVEFSLLSTSTGGAQ